jgi:predicted acylesterase/phospholipase RssA
VIVGLHPGAPVDEVAALLLTELRRFGTATRLTGIEPAALPDALDRAEHDYDRVVLATTLAPGAGTTTDAASAWTSACLGLADRIVGVATAPEPAAEIADEAALKGCDLIVAVHDPTAWIQAVAPRIHLHDGEDLTAPVAALARRLARRSVGIVLSGGGARALAHIGVLDELSAAGIIIDRVAGVSMGAYLGAQLAGGATPDMLAWRVREEFVLRNPFGDVTAPVVALTRGTRARAMLERTFGDRRIEDLPREFFCVSCDLLHNRQVLHRAGPLVEAVGASMCVPGIFPPVTGADEALVDGGVLNNLPVEDMAQSADGPVIAVDVTTPVRRFATLLPQPRRPRLERVAAVAREAVTGDPNPQLTIVEILMRTMLVGALDTTAAARRHADLVITPAVGDLVLLRFDQGDRAREAGREAAREALAAAPDLVATWSS